MRVLVLADEMFASREKPLLTRLEVGLADEGIRSIHAVPESLHVVEGAELFTQAITFEAHGWAVTRRVRARHLVRKLRELVGEDDQRPADIVHVFGGSVWEIGLEIGRQLEAAVALEVWRSGLVGRAASVQQEDPIGPIFMAPDLTIERALRAQKLSGTVRMTPWGVHVPDEPRVILPPGRAISVMFVGTGRESRPFCAALEGVLRLLKRHPDLLVFMDAKAAHRSGAWMLAQKLRLGDHISLIEDIEGRRDLLLQGDLLVIPEAGGEQRSILLDAMANAMVVVARHDPDVSALIEGRTAKLVTQPSADMWELAVGQVMDDAGAARQLTESARAYIRDQRLASAHIASVLQAYSWISSGDRLPFPAA
jgi:hypothetical protein